MKISKNSEKFSVCAKNPTFPPLRIGFFDSGVGGLAVLRSCIEKGLQGELFYYGDNFHAPYGNRTTEEILRYSLRAFDLFERLKVNAVVVACNTVTAVGLNVLREKYPFPIYGTSPPVSEGAKTGGKIFVLATKATVTSKPFKYTCAHAREREGVEIHAFGLEKLAGAIEEYLTKGEKFDLTAHLPYGSPDTVVLGCTHYSFVKNEIGKFYSCPVLDSSEYAASNFLNAFLQKVRERQPLVTTPTEFAGNNEKTNVRLFEFSKKGVFYPEKGGFLSISFLGKAKKVNKTVCEQMFAIQK
ncbi:MAG: aspartate/glutamate racemase family protein [Clostridia bacterium]|nr:aspartate/glutamate racemase family protein [Clostridia bacterium]